MSGEAHTIDTVTQRLPFPPQVIGIAGASGSGKTTLASELARELDGIHFPLDNYYFDLSHLPPADRAKENFDDPALIESSLLAAHVAALARGETIERPLYDFSHHIRIPDRTETMHAGAFVLVEGLFALYYPELLSLYQLRVFLDTPDDVCFDRRMRRDTIERGRSPSRCASSTKRRFGLPASPSCGHPRPMPTSLSTGQRRWTGKWSRCWERCAIVVFSSFLGKQPGTARR